MCVPFHYVRSRYIQMVLCWFHPLYGGSCRPFVGPIVAFPIGFSSGNGLDLPSLGSFSFGYPLSTWTSFRGLCFYALLARYDVRLAVCFDAQTEPLREPSCVASRRSWGIGVSTILRPPWEHLRSLLFLLVLLELKLHQS